jgi:hypothetical protein
MKVIMTLLVRDEEDIIRENIEFHLSQGVDFIIATDNKSEDATKSILKEYESKGLLHYIYEGEDNYNQHTWVTKMARMAYTDYQADWVINNDADEFWYPVKDNSLKDTFIKLSQKGKNIIEAKRSNFVYLGDNDKDKFYNYMIYREKESLNPIGKPLPPKQAHIGLKNIVINQGNHSVAQIKDKNIDYDSIEIFHFPIRSSQQLLNKIFKGGNAYENNKELAKNIGLTWRELYKKLKNDGNLDSYLKNNLYETDRIKTELQNGEILIDKTLKNYMRNLKIEH